MQDYNNHSGRDGFADSWCLDHFIKTCKIFFLPDIKPCSGSLKKGQRFFAGDQGETYAGRCFSQRPLLLILREPASANAVPGPSSVEDIMLYTKKDSAEENSDLRQNSLL